VATFQGAPAGLQGAPAAEWPLLTAGSVMSLIPMLIIFIVAQRYFVWSVAATRLAGT
jgi:multiple sugar transport system permease protein